MDGFQLRQDGLPVAMPTAAQRVAAFLAFHDCPLPRSYVAATLWPEASEERASASLRSAFWRLRQASTSLVEGTTGHIQLRPGVAVDVWDLTARARTIVDRYTSPEPADLDALQPWAELLPGWYEDWVLLNREQMQQLRLHALECLCERYVEVDNPARAVEAGLAAVGTDPLRESARRVLMIAYLAEGNSSEALRQYARFRQSLFVELGLEPSALMQELVSRMGSHPGTADVADDARMTKA